MKAQGPRKVRLLKIIAAETIRTLRRYYSGRELSKILGLSESVLSRYLSLDVVPSLEKSLEILEKVEKESLLEKVLARLIRVDKYGIVNIYSIAYDMSIVSLAAFKAYKCFSDREIDVVLTAAANGVPLATLVAYLLDARLAVAKKERDPSVLEMLEETSRTSSPPFITSLFLPKFALRKNDNVLIVDDLLQSGRTLIALQNFCRKSQANIIGVYALIALGTSWQYALSPNIPAVIVLSKAA
ncbi:MAG: hypothetical protein DRJ51_00595 [Thermoprotei archaeon]|nr:MAG: hypothetical protein DRJ51_00595 [Thermoprotei archaeon]RLF01196.1 MAG: hypothetical protein DRJ59_06650 [Thermoprotei archaeon]